MSVFRSDRTFFVLFVLFILASIWIALSGAYSMAYDEYLHFGVIKIYTHQWSPFFATQPPGADAYGALTRDPSYMYHYLMSFPLRIFAHYVHAFAAQIIFLRLFSIAFMAAGILVFRRAFKLAGVSRLVNNLALCFFLMLPVVPFMAAQVNYDPMILLVTALALFFTIFLVKGVNDTHELRLKPLVWLASLSLFGSLVKYAFLPILLGLSAFLIVFLWRNRRHWWPSIAPQLRKLRNLSGAFAILFLLLTSGLFIERYGVNIINYHTPTPECDQVIGLKQCLAYEPFARNYTFKTGHYDLPDTKIMRYPIDEWGPNMLRTMYFVVGNKENKYPAGQPLPLAIRAGYVVIIGGSLLVLVRIKWLLKQSVYLRLFFVLIVLYMAILYIQNFSDFLHTAVAVAIQGRYLMPIMPMLLVLVAMTAVDTFRKWRPVVGVSLVVILGLTTLQGGGLAPWLLRSHDNWLWNAPIVRTVNHAGRDILSPLIIK